jgi:hypothetical protein
MFSSRGKNLTFGRTHLTNVRQTGSKMNVVSNDRTRPAPREIQTDHFRVFKAASRSSFACLILSTVRIWQRGRRPRRHSPTHCEKSPMNTPEHEMEEQFTRSKLLLYQSKERHGDLSSRFLVQYRNPKVLIVDLRQYRPKSIWDYDDDDRTRGCLTSGMV